MYFPLRVSSGFLAFLCCCSSALAQTKTKAKSDEVGMVFPPASERYALPVVSVGAGATFYTGGLRSPRNLSKFAGTSWGVNAQVEQRFGKYFGGKLNAFYGLTAGERHTFTHFENFRARLTGVDLRFSFHLDHISGKRQPVAPYVSVGVGYLNSTVKSDLQDSQGRTYHLWDDGSLRDESQTGQTGGDPQVLKRDFRYETTLTKSAHTITFPVEAGFRFKLHDYWDFGIGYTHTFLLNRFMPAVNNLKPDHYGYAAATVYWYTGQVKR